MGLMHCYPKHMLLALAFPDIPFLFNTLRLFNILCNTENIIFYFS